MPLNKNSLIRYQILNDILQSSIRRGAEEILDILNERLRKDGYREVTKRTLYHDFVHMGELYGVEIANEQGLWFYKEQDESISSINLDSSQKAMLEMAIQTLKIFGGSSLFVKFNTIIHRIMTNSLLRKLDKEKIKQVIQLSDTPNDSGQNWLEVIFEAIVEQRVLWINYGSLGNPSGFREISPYLIKEYRNRWYCVAFDHISNSVRLFKLSRIKEVKSSTGSFLKSPEFSEEQYFQYSLGVFHSRFHDPQEVKLRVKGKIAQTIVEDPIHPTMKILGKDDNQDILISIVVYPTPELKNLILGYGANIEVLEPRSLRNEIVESLKKNLEVYR